VAGRKRRPPVLDAVRAQNRVMNDELMTQWRELCPPSPFSTDMDLETFLQTYRRQIEQRDRIERVLDEVDRHEPWTPDEIKWLSWYHVCEGLDEFDLEIADAYRFASNMLAGTNAEASWQMMKTRFDEMQRTLPVDERRPRSRRRRRS
jgi:hypothetical protein